MTTKEIRNIAIALCIAMYGKEFNSVVNDIIKAHSCACEMQLK